MPRIRDATEHDLPRIVVITNEAIANTTAVWSLSPVTLEARAAWLTERQGRGFPVLVAESDGAVLGFASFGDFRPWEGYLHTVEHSIYVHPDAQGRGAGKALLAALLDRAVSLGKHTMVAGIEAETRPRSGCTAGLALRKAAGCGRWGASSTAGWTWCSCSGC